MNWKQLPNLDIPIIFHSIKSESVMETDGKSLFNVNEVHKVSEYVENLMNVGLSANGKVKQEQIGIVTPYIAQVKMIRAHFKKYPNIDIGTTEFFQGREKPIMIISAVRTTNLNENIDFLDNPKVRNLFDLS